MSLDFYLNLIVKITEPIDQKVCVSNKDFCFMFNTKHLLVGTKEVLGEASFYPHF